MTLSRAVGGEDLAVTVDDIEMGAAMALHTAATTVDGAMKHNGSERVSKKTARRCCAKSTRALKGDHGSRVTSQRGRVEN